MFAKLRSWLALIRVRNLPSAWANIGTGFLLAHGSWSPLSELGILLLISTCLYSAGMVLNDWNDLDRDRRERPDRPLVRGAIEKSTAGWVGAGLLILSLIAALLAALFGTHAAPDWRPVFVASLLVLSLLAYDVVLKKSFFAPLWMGACRSLNVLLGASTGWAMGPFGWGFSITTVWVALGIGLYVAGITWFARNEAGQSRSLDLKIGLSAMIAGLLSLGLMPLCPVFQQEWMLGRRGWMFPLLILAIGLPLIRRATLAIVSRRPGDVQVAVTTALSSLIFIDASVCILAGRGSLVYGLVVLALLPLTWILRPLSRAT